MERVHVRFRRSRRQVATIPTHALVNNQHARVRALFVDDVREELGPFLRGRPRAEGPASMDTVANAPNRLKIKKETTHGLV